MNNPQWNRLDGKVAIVTGAGRGIGRAIAQALGKAGAMVAVAARTWCEIEETAASLQAEGIPSLAVTTDVGDWLSVRGLVKQVYERFGGIHILVNNAGVQEPIGPLVKNDPSDWMRTVQINLGGTFYCCKAVLPYMINQRYGKVINLSGGGATGPRASFSAYAVSKAGVVRLTETLAEEVKEYNVQVNAIAPGAVNTRMLEATLAAGNLAGEKALADARKQLESGGTPPQLAANLAVYLASEASKGLTGRLISAQYDGWENWGEEQIQEWMAMPWFTLRRMDKNTLKPFIEKNNQRGIKK